MELTPLLQQYEEYSKSSHPSASFPKQHQNDDPPSYILENRKGVKSTHGHEDEEGI